MNDFGDVFDPRVKAAVAFASSIADADQCAAVSGLHFICGAFKADTSLGERATRLGLTISRLRTAAAGGGGRRDGYDIPLSAAVARALSQKGATIEDLVKFIIAEDADALKAIATFSPGIAEAKDAINLLMPPGRLTDFTQAERAGEIRVVSHGRPRGFIT